MVRRYGLEVGHLFSSGRGPSFRRPWIGPIDWIRAWVFDFGQAEVLRPDMTRIGLDLLRPVQLFKNWYPQLPSELLNLRVIVL